MRKIEYFNEQEKQILVIETMANGEILTEETNLIEGNFLTFCALEEIPPIIIPEPTELELLQEDNAGLWYESMVQSTRVEANETEVANLWYELMMGGDIKCGSLELKSFTMLDIGQKKWWPMV